MISPAIAAKAYSAIQDSAGADKTKGLTGGSSFGDMVNSAINDAVSTSHNAEKQIANQVQGKAALIDVATAVSSAQASLETVMAVRDQVISAYQEIMRMTI